MFTAEQLEELRKRLHDDRREISSRGHSWDVADAMAVFEKYQKELNHLT